MKKPKDKEFLYVGHYTTLCGKYVLKVGTTNNLNRRQKEHNRAYSKTPHYPLAAGTEFEYDWYLPLSKYNTLRFEDKTKEVWKALGLGEYENNDRFVFEEKPTEVEVTIRKTYKISL